jgi:hypothetical protein
MGLATAAGLMAAAGPARAEGVDLTAQPFAISGATGTYHVVVNRTGANTFSVLVQGNNDGRKVAAGAANPVKHSIGRISVGFADAKGNFIAPNAPASTGFTTPAGGIITGGSWTTQIESSALRFNAPSEAKDVEAFGGNVFKGVAVLSTTDKVAFIKVALQNNAQQWANNGVPTVPEPGSLALLLPALAPFGLGLLRRGSRRKGSDPEAEDEG